MTTFSTPFGRLASIRRRSSKNKPVQPINLDAAKQYHVAGPSSAACSSLLTPRPHHFRSTSPSPATPSASASSRFVSSPTFVSSSALDAHDLDALTPPLSPVNPNSTVGATVTKSPLRRALSRSFFFGSSSSSSSSTTSGSSSGFSPACTLYPPLVPTSPRPARPARPSTTPAADVSADPAAFELSSSSSTAMRSQTGCPIIIAPQDSITTRGRSRTLLPPVTLPEQSAMERSASSPWSIGLACSPSPTASPASPPTSLRSIRQMHARKSIYSVFDSIAPSSCPVTTDWAELAERTSTAAAAPIRSSCTSRLTRRASEESFRCRGSEFDGPPAADPRASITSSYSLGFYAPRSVSMPSASGCGRMTDLIRSSYQEATPATDIEGDLTGLGLVDSLPVAPKMHSKRLSKASRMSLCESVASSASSLSLSSMEEQVQAPWPEARSSQTWFSACPPTPPSSIRLELDFRSLPRPTCMLASGSAEQSSKSSRPLSGIFISSNSSVLDLKETIASRMRELGYRLSPKNLTLTLHLSQDASAQSQDALGLKLSAQGQSAAKVLDDSSRLLFEEGAQEDDLVVVDCDPSHTLWNI